MYKAEPIVPKGPQSSRPVKGNPFGLIQGDLTGINRGLLKCRKGIKKKKPSNANTCSSLGTDASPRVGAAGAETGRKG